MLSPVSNAVVSAGQKPVQEQQGWEYVASGFEALLLHELLRPLQQPLFVSEEEAPSGFGGSLLGELSLLSLADYLAFRGQGIGLARWLYRHWTGQELPVKSGAAEAVLPPVRMPVSQQEPVAQAPNQRGSAAEQIRMALRPYWQWIAHGAAETGLPQELIAAVIWAESAGNPRAVSPAGAQGLMQLMPETARMLAVEDPFEPRQNILAGSRYLRQLLDQFGALPLALAAYNAGPGRVRQYGGIPPFAETQAYVRRVLQLYAALQGTATVVPASL